MIDVTLRILENLKKHYTESGYISGLYDQYCNIGGLSKKQLEDLLKKAKKSEIIPESQLATLEAIIKKKPTRYKSEKITKAPEMMNQNDEFISMITDILKKYPQHKMALFLQSKIGSQTPLTDFETKEIRRLATVLLK